VGALKYIFMDISDRKALRGRIFADNYERFRALVVKSSSQIDRTVGRLRGRAVILRVSRFTGQTFY